MIYNNKKLSSILSSSIFVNHIKGLKIEFESEGATLEEAHFFKSIAISTGLDLIIKIGGVSAKRNFYESVLIGCNSIVAPMVESEYALQKFTAISNSLFQTQLQNSPNLYINIETISGYKNLKSIINMPEFNFLTGVVFGRSDFAKSINKTKDFVNSQEILDIAIDISNKISAKNKKFIVGGNMSIDSIPFLKKIPFLTGFETRNILFNAEALNDCNIEKSFIKATEFEIQLIKEIKKNIYSII